MKLGKAFSDSLVIESKSTNLLKDPEAPWWHGAGRALMFATILVIAIFILFFRLFHLTLVQGHYYRNLSDNNRTRELVRHAPRGLILDRFGQPLSNNKQRIRKNGAYEEIDFEREYVLDSAASHLLGYTSEISGEELKDDYYSLRRYLPGDQIGRVGAEAIYEEKLRGRNGRELVEVDAAGKIVRTLGIDEAIPGENITLSLDSALMKAVEAAFPIGEKGAVIVSKPSTGEVLALYSSPSFSTNAFIKGLTAQEYQGLVNNPQRPMFNRVIGGVYPPGSTYKLIPAIAGLMEGVINKNTIVEDNGVITIDKFTFPNWYFKQYGKVEGAVDLVKALQRSNDIYFYKLGEWLGVTKIADWSRRMGIGKPLGIELPGEASGLMPDPAWKQSYFTSPADLEARNNLWYLGDTYHIGIGQGYLLTTPLQVNAWTNVVANGGKLCRPTILKQVSSVRRQEECKDLEIKKEAIDLVIQGMLKACETGGTGWPLFNFSVKRRVSSIKNQTDNNLTPDALTSDTNYLVPIACKTGTAEFGDPDDHTHAWFTAFGPIPGSEKISVQSRALNSDVITGEPEISVTVLVEEAGQGSDIAGPVAKKIFEEWFGR